MKINHVNNEVVTVPIEQVEMENATKEVEDKLKKENKDPQDKPFVGAEKQPLPKEIELPKAKLEESLFEDCNEELNEAITDGEPGNSFAKDVYNALANIAFEYDGDIHDASVEEKKAWFQEAFDLFMLKFFTENESLNESNGVREYSDILFDYIEGDVVDAKQVAEDLIYWCSEDDIKRYMEVNEIISFDDEEDESLKEAKLDNETIYDMMYNELFMDTAHDASARKISNKEVPNAARFRSDDEVEFDRNDGPKEGSHEDARNGKVVEDGFLLDVTDPEKKAFAIKVAEIYDRPITINNGKAHIILNDSDF